MLLLSSKLYTKLNIVLHTVTSPEELFEAMVLLREQWVAPLGSDAYSLQLALVYAKVLHHLRILTKLAWTQIMWMMEDSATAAKGLLANIWKQGINKFVFVLETS